MTRRLVIFRLVLAAAFALILLRLLSLQVLHGAENRRFAEENRLRVVPRAAPRGVIYDRRGRVLATSRLAFSVRVVPEELGVVGAEDPAAALAGLLDLPREQVARLLAHPRGKHAEVVVLPRASEEVVARLAERAPYLTGVAVTAEAVRDYPNGALAGHVLGYVRQISAEELTQAEAGEQSAGEVVGKEGVERSANAVLRGQDGGEQIEVEATGRRVRTLGAVAPQPGQALRLTLDLEVQRSAEAALAGRAGAVVAMDPETGEVLALASQPAYDPNLFAGPVSREEWQRLSGPERPQQNRAISARYAPGSVFKIITAAAALEAGACDERSTFYCGGRLLLGGWTLRCWKREGHGAVDYLRGFAQSCNVMFATLGRRVGPEALAQMAARFGLGEETRIDLLGEVRGTVPTPRWKRQVKRLPWYPGDTCQMAIGQGDVLVTPVQVARAVAVVANGGYLVRPHVIAGESRERKRVELKPATLAALRAGLEAVAAEGGTAASIANPYYRVAGKTGTAEAPSGAPHAWFAGYAPAEAPKVVVAVVLEHGGHGGEAAAPVAKQVFDAALRPSR